MLKRCCCCLFVISQEEKDTTFFNSWNLKTLKLQQAKILLKNRIRTKKKLNGQKHFSSFIYTSIHLFTQFSPFAYTVSLLLEKDL